MALIELDTPFPDVPSIPYVTTASAPGVGQGLVTYVLTSFPIARDPSYLLAVLTISMCGCVSIK